MLIKINEENEITHHQSQKCFYAVENITSDKQYELGFEVEVDEMLRLWARTWTLKKIEKKFS